jgi:segregation and condensation protein B
VTQGLSQVQADTYFIASDVNGSEHQQFRWIVTRALPMEFGRQRDQLSIFLEPVAHGLHHTVTIFLCPMLMQYSTPAQQLHSACQRYAGPWQRAIGSRRYAAQTPFAIAIAIESPIRGDIRDIPTGERQLARLEAILFLAREPLTSRKLSQYANLADGTQARTLVRRLNEQYDGAGRAFRVEQVAGGYQLLTRRKLAPWLRRLAHVPGETRLSAPALETLAVIAYRQPVPRADIEAIRGVNCGEILRQLMDRDLVRIGGRSDDLGRPYLYATTKRFLELFGLNHSDELPHREALRSTPLPTAPLVIPQPSEPPPSDREAEPEFSDEPIDETRSESTFG